MATTLLPSRLAFTPLEIPRSVPSALPAVARIFVHASILRRVFVALWAMCLYRSRPLFGVAFSLAPATKTVASIDARVVKRVTMFAMRLAYSLTMQIFRLCHRFQVVRPDARANVAQVIYLESVRNGADNQFVRDPVSDGASFRVGLESPVPTAISACHPKPAITITVHLHPEALFKRQSTSGQPIDRRITIAANPRVMPFTHAPASTQRIGNTAGDDAAAHSVPPSNQSIAESSIGVMML